MSDRERLAVLAMGSCASALHAALVIAGCGDHNYPQRLMGCARRDLLWTRYCLGLDARYVPAE